MTADIHQQHPTFIYDGDDDKADQQLTFESLSKPPSSVLEDGRFIYLPPANSSFFFGRSIAKYNLVKAEGGNSVDDDEDEDKGLNDGSRAIDKSTSKKAGKNEEGEEDEQTQTLHPIHFTSARIHTHGINELSKVINLSSLIRNDEYFGLTSVVDATTRSKNDAVSKADGVGVATAGGTSSASSSTKKPAEAEEALARTNNIDDGGKESRLRAQYVLKRKQSQFESSSSTFHSHYKKLKVVTTAQHTVDERLLQLRKRWRLVSPDHGVHVSYPIQPCDVIAIDVDIYSNSNSSNDYGIGAGGLTTTTLNHSSMLGRIARMVPRFATIELSNEYDIQAQLKLQQRRQSMLKHKSRVHGHHHGHHHHHKHDHENKNDNSNANVKDEDEDKDKEVESKKTDDMIGGGDQSSSPKVETDSHSNFNTSTNTNTIAQPFLITESSSNELQKDTVDDVPMLTLLLEIEKSSTGFVQSVSLSSNIASSTSSPSSSASSGDDSKMDIDTTTTKSQQEATTTTTAQKQKKDDDSQTNITKAIIDKKIQLHNDELLIQSLQHSLFCANVFDSIRQEIIHDQQQEQQHHPQNATAAATATATATQRQYDLKKKKPAKNSNVQQNKKTNQQHIAWLSCEMEDSFLPPPSLMAGRNQTFKNASDVDIINNDVPNSPLSVIYCHEGEVKVQLDAEYSLTIKLVDVNNRDCNQEYNGRQQNGIRKYNGEESDGSPTTNANSTMSGSQTPEQLHILCRLLLLQAQLVYHNNRKEQLQKLDEAIQAQKDDMAGSKIIDYSAGMNRRGGTFSTAVAQTQATLKQNEKLLSMIKPPCILQSCVGLGTKVILERKVRKALKRLMIWQKRRKIVSGSENHFKVEWLPLSLSDPYSRFALSLNAYDVLDVNIFANKISVTSFGEDSVFQVVHFGSSEEFELFVKNKLQRLEGMSNGSNK